MHKSRFFIVLCILVCFLLINNVSAAGTGSLAPASDGIIAIGGMDPIMDDDRPSVRGSITSSAVVDKTQVYLNQSGSGSEPALGWKFRGNLNNTGEYDDGGIRPGNVKLWEFKMGSGGETGGTAILDGYVYGTYDLESGGLTQLIFYLKVPEEGEEVRLDQIEYLYSKNYGAANVVVPVTGNTGSLAPGQRTKIILDDIGGPMAGYAFSLEIKPLGGSSILIQQILPSGYYGGVIYNANNTDDTVVFIDGYVYGTLEQPSYYENLDQLLFYIKVPEDVYYPQSLDEIIWLYAKDYEEVTEVTPTIGRTGSLLPGERTRVVIDGLSGPMPGGKITLEMKPRNGASSLFQTSLASGYMGGLIITDDFFDDKDYSIVLDGYLYGDAPTIQTLIFYLKVPEGLSAVQLDQILYLYSIDDGEVTIITPTIGNSGYLFPGERTQITFENLDGPSPGGKLTLEIKPKTGDCQLIVRTLASGYSGGVII